MDQNLICTTGPLILSRLVILTGIAFECQSLWNVVVRHLESSQMNLLTEMFWVLEGYRLVHDESLQPEKGLALLEALHRGGVYTYNTRLALLVWADAYARRRNDNVLACNQFQNLAKDNQAPSEIRAVAARWLERLSKQPAL